MTHTKSSLFLQYESANLGSQIFFSCGSNWSRRKEKWATHHVMFACWALTQEAAETAHPSIRTVTTRLEAQNKQFIVSTGREIRKKQSRNKDQLKFAGSSCPERVAIHRFAKKKVGRKKLKNASSFSSLLCKFLNPKESVANTHTHQIQDEIDVRVFTRFTNITDF